MKLKLTVINLWISACVAYGFGIIMAFQGKLAASILFTMIYLLLLISTRWITNNGEIEVHPSQEYVVQTNIELLAVHER